MLGIPRPFPTSTQLACSVASPEAGAKKTYSKGEWTRVENVVRSQSVTRGHQWKLFPGRCRVNIRKQFFFCEHVIAPWNSLNIVSDDQRSVDTFRRLDVRSDLSSFVYY